MEADNILYGRICIDMNDVRRHPQLIERMLDAELKGLRRDLIGAIQRRLKDTDEGEVVSTGQASPCEA